MYKKILIATDGSTHINRAVPIIIGFHKKWGSKIVIFHSIKHMLEKVIPPSRGLTVPYDANLYLIGETTSQPRLIKGVNEPEIKSFRFSEVFSIAKNILTEKKTIFDEVQVPVKIKMVKNENPEDYIQKVGKKYDLIVIGIKGVHSKLSQVFLGSVAEAVVKNAPCDVMVIR
ncbi:MAG: universal stress protein [Promethearchaeota archaeon]